MRVCVCACKIIEEEIIFFSIFIVIVAIAATAAASTTIAARIITILISYLYFVKRNQTFFLQSFINLTLGFKRVHVFSSRLRSFPVIIVRTFCFVEV